MNAYDKLLAQLHAMTASAGRRPAKAKKHQSKAKPEQVAPAAHHPPKKGRHGRAKQKKGRR
jgi:hypothetical protein